MATSNQIFVNELFQKMLYRAPTAAELSYYAERLDGGLLSRGKVAFDLSQRPEYGAQVEDVARLYWAAFDRVPDQGGLMFWNEVHRNGATLPEIAAIFATAPEFVSAYGVDTSNADFVRVLYANVLDRAPDAAGAAYWNALLSQGRPRGAVLNDFAQSRELTTKLGNDIKTVVAYALLAARMPTATELDKAPGALDLLFAEAARAAPADQFQPGLNWSATTFAESALNNGSIAGSAIITVEGDTFKGAVGAKLGKVDKVPAGLTAALVKVSPTEAKLSFTGKATAHAAAVSVEDVAVTFSAADFTSGKAPEVPTRNDIAIVFKDFSATVTGSTLAASLSPSLALVVDLAADTLKHGTTAVTPDGGSLAAANNVDFSAMPVPAVAAKGAKPVANLITFKGGSEANVYAASPLGDNINGGGGSDTITLNSGVDTVVFPTAASGPMTIHGFKPGAGGDVLKLSPFLTVPKTAGLATVIDSNVVPPLPASQRAWVNGDVLLVVGVTSMTQSDVAALFGTYLKDPTTARKAVVLSSDVSGDTSIWYVTNASGSGVTDIVASEVELVGVLKDVNNLELSGFAASNFA